MCNTCRKGRRAAAKKGWVTRRRNMRRKGRKQRGKGFREAWDAGKKSWGNFKKYEPANAKAFAKKQIWPMIWKRDKEKFAKQKGKEYAHGMLKRLSNVGVSAIIAL